MTTLNIVLIVSLVGLAGWNLMQQILIGDLEGDISRRVRLNQYSENIEELFDAISEIRDERFNSIEKHRRSVFSSTGFSTDEIRHYKRRKLLDHIEYITGRLRLLYDHFDLEVQEECEDSEQYPKLIEKDNEN